MTLGEVDDEQVVGAAIERCGELLAALARAVQQRLVVAGDEAGLLALAAR